jgi:uncharacterized SAM-binding protein YcdF (DUF218 family)
LSRRLIVLLALSVTLILLAFYTVTKAGAWLVVQDPLQPALAVVVLGGQMPFRAMEAARIYRQGSAREVWLTEGAATKEDLALRRLQIDATPEYAVSRLVLERLGIPATAIHVIGPPVTNTADEIRAVAASLAGAGGERVIFVTSKSHTRRVKVLWRSLVGRRPEAVVRYATDDSFEPERWWRTTRGGIAVVREWLGLLNTWLGLPIPAEGPS